MERRTVGHLFFFISLVFLANFGAFVRSECVCNGIKDLNFTCFEHCEDEKCHNECAQEFQNRISKLEERHEIVSKLDVKYSTKGPSLNVSIELNSKFADELKPLEIQKFRLEYTSAFIDEFGTIRGLKEDTWTWTKIPKPLKFGEQNDVSLRIPDPKYLTAGRVVCAVSNGLGITHKLDEQFVKHHLSEFSMEWNPNVEISSLQIHYEQMIYGFPSGNGHLTLQWVPVRQWPTTPSKYHVQCQEVHANCNRCTAQFSSCRKCAVKNGQFINSVTDWFRPIVVFQNPMSSKDVLQRQHPRRNPQTALVCAVRAVGAFDKSVWSSPTKVEFAVTTPLPRLILSYVSRRNYSKLLTLDVMSSSPETGALRVREESGWIWGYQGVDAEYCCRKTAGYVPTVINLPIQNPFAPETLEKTSNRYHKAVSFCINWIAGLHYDVAPCSRQEHSDSRKLSWCVTEVDDTPGPTLDKIIFRSKPGQEIYQILCNPLHDFVAFSMDKEQGDSQFQVKIVYRTNMKAVDMDPYMFAPNDIGGHDYKILIPISSSAVTLDWTAGVGRIVFLTSKGKDEYLVRAYELVHDRRFPRGFTPRSRHIYGNIKMGTDENIMKIGLDWSYFYVLKHNTKLRRQLEISFSTQLQFYKLVNGRIDGSKAYNVTSVIAEYGSMGRDAATLEILGQTGNILFNRSISQVVDFMPMAGTMRQVPESHAYYPRFGIADNKSTTKHALKLKINFQYKTGYYSLKPVFRVVVRYRKHIVEDNRTCHESMNCQTVQTGMSIGRSGNSIETTLGNLTDGQKYYMEVNIEPLRATWYNYKADVQTLILLHKYEPLGPGIKYIMIMIFAPIAVLVVCMAIGLGIYMSGPKRKLRYLDRIRSSDIKEDLLLGRGKFSEVYRVVMAPKGQKIIVVSKVPKRNSREESSRLLQEAFILQHCNHGNIIKPIGVCFDAKPFKLILEYFPDGSLIQYLASNHQLSLMVKIQIGIDIAKAGVYLHTKGFIHRDISAKNILIRLGKGKKFLKAVLSDFGLAKDHGDTEPYTTILPEFPILHSAPEAFVGQFSIQSDVFSFATMLWEVFTGGEVPYSDIFDESVGIPFRELSQMICEEGVRPATTAEPLGEMIQPSGSPSAIWNLIQDCWKKVPSERPIFAEVLSRLECQMRRSKAQDRQDVAFLPDLLHNFVAHDPPPCLRAESENSSERENLIEGCIVEAYSRDQLDKEDEDENFMGQGITHKIRHACPGKTRFARKRPGEISDGRAMATVRFALRSHSPAIRNFFPGSYERSELSRSEALV